jgi:hypothetical protein
MESLSLTSRSREPGLRTAVAEITQAPLWAEADQLDFPGLLLWFAPTSSCLAWPLLRSNSRAWIAAPNSWRRCATQVSVLLLSASTASVCAFCFQNSNTIGSSLCLGGLTRFCGGATIFADTTNFIIGAVANLAVAIVIVRYIYYPLTQNKNYVFTFLAFNTIIYFVMSSLTSVEIGIGVSLGLLAIFGVLRNRTDPIPIREMTYLFIVIALCR